MKKILREWLLPPAIFMLVKSFIFKIKFFIKYNNIDFAKNKEIKNLHIDKRCFIIGLGTSINKQDLKLLKDEIVIGISSLFNHKDLEYIQPNYYVLSPVIDNHSKYVNKDNLIKWLQAMDEKLDNSVVMFIYIGDKKYIDENKIFKNKNIYWLNYEPWDGRDISDIKLDKIPSISNVSEVALSVALYLGFKEINIIGFDLTWYEGVYKYYDDKKVNQFFGKTQYDVKKEHNFDSESEMRAHAEVFKKFKALYQMKQNIFNANADENSYVDTFPKVKYEDLFEKKEDK